MTRYSVAPAYVKFNYTSNGHTHWQTLLCKLATGTFETPNLLLGDSTSSPWDTVAAGWSNILAAMLSEASIVNFAELWSKPEPDDDPIWLSVTSLADAGTATGAAVPYSMETFTFRTQAGSIMRVVVLEGTRAVNLKIPAGTGNANEEALHDYVMDPAAPWIGRDDSWPAVGIRYTTKTNDKLRKKFLLDV